MRKNLKTGIAAAACALALSVFGFAGVALAANGSGIDAVVKQGIVDVNKDISSNGAYAELSDLAGDTITTTINNPGANIARVQSDILKTLVNALTSNTNTVRSIECTKTIYGGTTPGVSTTLTVNGGRPDDPAVIAFAKACVGKSGSLAGISIGDLVGKGFTVKVNGMTADYDGTYTMNFVASSTPVAPVVPETSAEIDEVVTKPETVAKINDRIEQTASGLAVVAAPTEGSDGTSLVWNVEITNPEATTEQVGKTVVGNIVIAAQSAKAKGAEYAGKAEGPEPIDLTTATDTEITDFTQACVEAALKETASTQAAGSQLAGKVCKIMITGATYGTEAAGADKDFTIYEIKFDAATELVPVYRLCRYVDSYHLYTTDENEYNVLKAKSDEWSDEGIALKAASTGGDNVTRFYQYSTKTHLYTADPREIAALRENPDWFEDGQEISVGWANAGKVRVFRLYNPELDQHLLTANQHEVDVVTTKQGWQIDDGCKLYAMEGMSQ